MGTFVFNLARQLTGCGQLLRLNEVTGDAISSFLFRFKFVSWKNPHPSNQTGLLNIHHRNCLPSIEISLLPTQQAHALTHTHTHRHAFSLFHTLKQGWRESWSERERERYRLTERERERERVRVTQPSLTTMQKNFHKR